MRKMVGLLLGLILYLLLGAACQLQVMEVDVTRIVDVMQEMEEMAYADETAVIDIPLAGPITERDAEISGMTWYGDNLILMPQYPNWTTGDEGEGFLFAISKEAIHAYLDGSTFEPLEPAQIPFSAPGAQEEIDGFEGFEAISFVGDEVFMTIEAATGDGMMGYLLKGTIAPDLSGITMDTANMVPLESQSGVGNMSDEVMLVIGDTLATIHEASGPAVNEAPVAHLFDTSLADAGTVPLQSPEYRLTDATTLDEANRFWAINYFFPGDEDLLPESDAVAEMYGRGLTHAASDGVERLVEFVYTDDGITMTDTPPMQIQLMADGSLRNWEGLTRLDDAGFLLATDKWPQTILAFLPLPEPDEE
jgi:hypothetical protein